MNKTSSSALLHGSTANTGHLAKLFAARSPKTGDGKKLYAEIGKHGRTLTTEKPGLWARITARRVAVKGDLKKNVLQNLYTYAKDDVAPTARSAHLLLALDEELDRIRSQPGDKSLRTTARITSILTELKKDRIAFDATSAHEAVMKTANAVAALKTRAREPIDPQSAAEAIGPGFGSDIAREALNGTLAQLQASAKQFKAIELDAGKQAPKLGTITQMHRRAAVKAQLTALGEISAQDIGWGIRPEDATGVEKESQLQDNVEIIGAERLRSIARVSESAMQTVTNACARLRELSSHQEPDDPSKFQRACTDVVNTIHSKVATLQRAATALMTIGNKVPNLPNILCRELAVQGQLLLDLAGHIVDERGASGMAYRIATLGIRNPEGALDLIQGTTTPQAEEASEAVAGPIDPLNAWIEALDEMSEAIKNETAAKNGLFAAQNAYLTATEHRDHNPVRLAGVKAAKEHAELVHLAAQERTRVAQRRMQSAREQTGQAPGIATAPQPAAEPVEAAGHDAAVIEQLDAQDAVTRAMQAEQAVRNEVNALKSRYGSLAEGDPSREQLASALHRMEEALLDAVKRTAVTGIRLSEARAAAAGQPVGVRREVASVANEIDEVSGFRWKSPLQKSIDDLDSIAQKFGLDTAKGTDALRTMTTIPQAAPKAAADVSYLSEPLQSASGFTWRTEPTTLEEAGRAHRTARVQLNGAKRTADPAIIAKAQARFDQAERTLNRLQAPAAGATTTSSADNDAIEPTTAAGEAPSKSLGE